MSLTEVTNSNTAKRKGISNQPTEEHLVALKTLAENIFQPIRDHFGSPIWVSSGYRSAALNKAIGGAKKSQHCKGEALDLDMDGKGSPTNAEIFYYIKDNLPFDQLIWEFGSDKSPDWVHVSYSVSEKQRGQILKAKRNSAGKTYYETYN
ncbi:D-Ala-D-Ala carboxypeptidase family metallohydrolase [Winogradskyella sp.]|uniref:D-Ala-D-Ala carboxypeptidase family metallohydrolase n=1 Tax=Winogradskyella sp. TaxID=1883156 RepID=UPI0035180F8D